MDHFIRLFNSYAFTLLVAAALCWLCIRAYRVLSKPADELINLLGLEVPAAPSLSLAGVKADGFVLHWKAGDPDQSRQASITYQVYLNGINIGELSPQDPVFSISRLRPDHGYIIRLLTVAAGGFSATSNTVRVQTKPETSKEFFQTLLEDEDAISLTPLVQPYKGPREPSAASVAATSMVREQSNSQSQQKRIIPHRRLITANSIDQVLDGGSDAVITQGDISELHQQVNQKREEQDKVEQQIKKDEEEYNANKTVLERKKAELRRQTSEKDGGSKDLKRQVTSLEHAEKGARATRLDAERKLQHKQRERAKLRSDIAEWDEQISQLLAEAKRMEAQQETYQQETEQRIAELKEQAVNQATDNLKLEEAIKEQKAHIRDLEQENRTFADGQGLDGVDERATEESAWSQHLIELHSKYNSAWRRLEEAKAQHQELANTTRIWEQMRQETPHMFIPPSAMEILPSRRTSLHRGRSSSLRNELSPQAQPFEMVTSAAFPTALTSVAPSYSTSSFFTLGNGTSIAPPRTFGALTAADIDPLSGGGMTSPGTLLPSNLLNDDTDTSTDLLPGLGAPETLELTQQEPNSPASVQSRSPSDFASPQNSTPNLPLNSSFDIHESDGRSIRSTAGSGRAVSISNNTATGSRFTSLFGFSRQRGKTFSDEGPALGSLKIAETHSFPRDFATHDSARFPRRNSQSGSSWNSLLLGTRNSTAGAESNDVVGGKRHFNPFKSKTETWPVTNSGDKPPSPRPGSTHSMETSQLPRPGAATESAFGWPVSNKAFGPRHSPLAAEWGQSSSLNAPTAGPWSRHPSRRPSMQYGSGLPTGADVFLTDVIDGSLDDADFDLNPSRESPKQAPIGTRPKSSSATAKEAADAAAAIRLNPNAPSFKTLFTGKKADKEQSTATTEPTKKRRRGRGKNLSSSTTAERIDQDAASNANGKSEATSFTGPEILVDLANSHHSTPNRGREKAHYAPSTSTATDSAASPRNSLDNLKSPIELDPPNSAARETFMQRLSRKSSASMFALGGRLLKKSTDAEGGAHGAADDTDEEGSGLLSPSSFAAGNLASLGEDAAVEGHKLSPGLQAQKPGGMERQKTGFSLRRKGRKREKGSSAAGEEEDVTAEE